ncbi:MORC family CW-type zinc finger protein 3-like isoform X2 [Mugil cephalus]|uniref:MORC family CW-type zinc finger protein 3-like isoform X2 n=1 Tax=Mugil cephalus TaxID=48193 RepID=UPI001FB5FFFC|nr:MORC family CW-type zinc finger protein 3-like isoform X2 [Mugil cephalus]
MATQTDRGVPLSTLAPKFLHSNSTSHTWPFSAIAELIDNAYDPDVNASQFWIDKTVIKDEECLTFMDNGNGLDYETMHKLLSFGYSDKTAVNGKQPIGMYGNGFKSGSMRLGKDVIVFSKSKNTSCVGMLSQTYLEKIDAKQIVVPIISFETRNANYFSVREEHKASLQDILRYSPFSTREELLAEVDAINSSWSKAKTGSRIIIWNLRRTSTGKTEFDFEKDRYDIRIPTDVYEELQDPTQIPASYTPECVFSLRAYCSILYLKPRMQIVVRGQKVKSQLIAKSLACIRKDHYKPTFLNRRITITFGYNTKSKDQYGIMMYHKNRLIKAYKRVGCQLKANNMGVGVIGVIECNFLDPTHNKQDFMENDNYRKTINNLGIKLEEYWKEIRYSKTKDNPNSTVPVEDTMNRPDQNWVQCDQCLKWRKLPDGIDNSKLPEKWFCRMNPDPQFRSCNVDEEPEDSDDDQPSYRKTYKQQENKKKRQTKRQTSLHSPSTPTTPKTRIFQGGGEKAGSTPLSSSNISQAACSPSTSSSSGLPVISDVFSLSVTPQSLKRSQPVTPQTKLKRPRVNGLHSSTPTTPSSVDVRPLSPKSVPHVSDDDDDDDETEVDTDDDIVILEIASTPKPKKPVVHLTKVKKEEESSQIPISMECGNDAAADATSEIKVEGASSAESAAVESCPSPSLLDGQASTTTQTEVRMVKQEVDSQNQTEREEGAPQSTSACTKEQSSGVNVCSAEQKLIKQESSENTGEKVLQIGVAHNLISDQRPGPSSASSSPHHYPNITEVQEQQDQLLELMQDTAVERDRLKERVRELTYSLQDVQRRLQDQSQVNVRKEVSHQESQTEETEGKTNYKSLFEKVKKRVNELVRDKEALLEASEMKPNGEEEDNDEISMTVDRLLHELDQRDKERDELRSQLSSLEEEKANLAAQCEELRLSMQQQQQQRMENAAEGSSGPQRDHSHHTYPSEAGSLIELRQNVGRLLASFMPVLDLQQVNYDCNVIDEMLEQVLSDDSILAQLRARYE